MLNEETLNERGGDAAILALFQEWKEAQCAISDAAAADRDADVEAAIERADALEERIIAAESGGAPGLAIKAFFAVLSMRGAAADGAPGAIDAFREGDYNGGGELMIAGQRQRALLADAARFAPELGPLVSEILNGPLARPVAPQPADLLRHCAEETAAEFGRALPEGEAGLLEAERRLRALDEARARLRNAAGALSFFEKQEILDRALEPVRKRLCEAIEGIEPETLAGALVHLRHQAEVAEHDFALRKILAVIEKAPPHPAAACR